MRETYCIPLVLDLRSSRRNLVCKTADVVTQVFFVVNSINHFTEAAGLACLLASLEWTDIQAVTQEELFVEGCWIQLARNQAVNVAGALTKLLHL
jgi:hypothetical protein